MASRVTTIRMATYSAVTPSVAADMIIMRWLQLDWSFDHMENASLK